MHVRLAWTLSHLVHSFLLLLSQLWHRLSDFFLHVCYQFHISCCWNLLILDLKKFKNVFSRFCITVSCHCDVQWILHKLIHQAHWFIISQLLHISRCQDSDKSWLYFWLMCEKMSKLCESFKNQIKNLLLKAKLWDLHSIQDIAWREKKT